MLDETLAEVYGVATKVFNQAVRRNRDRFPPDFLLEISTDDWKSLRSQFVTLEMQAETMSLSPYFAGNVTFGAAANGSIPNFGYASLG